LTYNKCPLYSLNSKKMLSYLLKIPSKQYFSQDFIAKKIHPYIEINDIGKKRLIEPPDEDIKNIQTRIKNCLSMIEVPEYVFSGIKRRSYVDNARLHIGKKYIYKTDLTAFFPSTQREKVYSFFRYKLATSSDVADILTNYTTINLDIAACDDIAQINNFLNVKGVAVRNHLISGAPTSQILSYLANVDMFDQLYSLSEKNNMTMTVYVDDVTFSSPYFISYRIRKQILNIFNKNGFQVSNQKVKFYAKAYPKLVTGVIINSKGQIVVKNSLRKRTVDEFNNLKKNPDDKICRRKLRGLVTSTRQIDRNAFPSIKLFAFDKKYKVN